MHLKTNMGNFVISLSKRMWKGDKFSSWDPCTLAIAKRDHLKEATEIGQSGSIMLDDFQFDATAFTQVQLRNRS